MRISEFKTKNTIGAERRAISQAQCKEVDSGETLSNQPIRLPGLKSGVCLSTSSRSRVQPRGSGLILSGAFYPELKSGVCPRPELRPRCAVERIKFEDESRCISPFPFSFLFYSGSILLVENFLQKENFHTG